MKELDSEEEWDNAELSKLQSNDSLSLEPNSYDRIVINIEDDNAQAARFIKPPLVFNAFQKMMTASKMSLQSVNLELLAIPACWPSSLYYDSIDFFDYLPLHENIDIVFYNSLPLHDFASIKPSECSRFDFKKLFNRHQTSIFVDLVDHFAFKGKSSCLAQNQLWTQKFEYLAADRFSKKAVKEISRFIKEFDLIEEDLDDSFSYKRSKTEGRVLYLTGPVGSGKRSILEHCAKKYSFEILEISSDTNRSSKSLQAFLESTQSKRLTNQFFNCASRLAQKTIVLIQNVDVVFSCDKGFHSTLKEFIINSKVPFVLTSNCTERELELMEGLPDISDIIQLDLSCRNMFSFIDSVVNEEELCISEFLASFLQATCMDDPRLLLNMAQFILAKDDKMSIADLYSCYSAKFTWNAYKIPKSFAFGGYFADDEEARDVLDHFLFNSRETYRDAYFDCCCNSSDLDFICCTLNIMNAQVLNLLISVW